MNNRKALIGKIIIALGSILVLAAIGLFSYNEYENSVASNNVASVYSKLTKAINNNENRAKSDLDSPVSTNIALKEDEPIPEMDTINIDGKDYIGYISIPSLNLELPILSNYVYEDLRIAPARYSGSVYSNDLVIAGHNYKSHFNPLQHIEKETQIFFIDVNGFAYEYYVADTEILQPAQIEDMINSDYDLTLFTCTYGGKTRLTVRCLRVED